MTQNLPPLPTGQKIPLIIEHTEVSFLPKEEVLPYLRNIEPRVPVLEVYDRAREVLVQFDIPGAVRDNTLLAWDEEEGRLLVAVVEAADPAQGPPPRCRWAGIVPLAGEFQPDLFMTHLKEGILTIYLPREQPLSSNNHKHPQHSFP